MSKRKIVLSLMTAVIFIIAACALVKKKNQTSSSANQLVEQKIKAPFQLSVSGTGYNDHLYFKLRFLERPPCAKLAFTMTVQHKDKVISKREIILNTFERKCIYCLPQKDPKECDNACDHVTLMVNFDLDSGLEINKYFSSPGPYLVRLEQIKSFGEMSDISNDRPVPAGQGAPAIDKNSISCNQPISDFETVFHFPQDYSKNNKIELE